MADDTAEFWNAFEKETGEKVEARSIGEWFSDGVSAPSYWGLVILTDRSFRFKRMPSDNWLLSLIKRPESPSTRDAPVDLVMERGAIAEVIVPQRGFFARLFGSAFPRVLVTGRIEGEERRYFFSVDPSSGILEALQKAFAREVEAESAPSAKGEAEGL